jgi:DNA-binding response OmpR family regulator
MTADNSNKKRILVIDDDPGIHKVIQNSQMAQLYELILATVAETGLAIAVEQRPDVIILDVVFQGMDGYQVLEQLKKQESTKDIPVIMMTIKSGDEDIQRGLDLGAADYISKPLSVDLLIKRIEQNFT